MYLKDSNHSVDLSIIIVNWKCIPYLRQCLRSIYANQAKLECELIVVDNASGDDCCKVLSQEFPRVQCICSPVNIGFAAANNLGFTQSRGRSVLFLNPDTEVTTASLQSLVSTLEAEPDAGIVGARLLNSDLTLQTSCVQSFPTILNQMLDADALRDVFPCSRLWGTRALFETASGPARVDVVSGACLMVKREIFKRVGGFSTQYFMYSEDVDLCWRIRRAGWSTYYVASATVIHHGGRSSMKEPQNGFAIVLMRESRMRLLDTWRGAAYAATYRATMAVAAILRLTVLNALIVVVRSRDRKKMLLNSAAKWTKIFRWAIGLEPWAKELSLQGGRA